MNNGLHERRSQLKKQERKERRDQANLLTDRKRTKRTRGNPNHQRSICADISCNVLQTITSIFVALIEKEWDDCSIRVGGNLLHLGVDREL